MQFIYLDEAGCPGSVGSPTSPIQPAFIIGGVILEINKLRDFTFDFLQLKKRYFPGMNRGGDFLDWIRVEIKGANLRKSIREEPRDSRRHVIGFLDHFLNFLERYNARLIARVYIKPVGGIFVGKSVYTSAVQCLAADFQSFLESKDDTGLMILDSRNKALNANVSHSIFTQKFKCAGDAYKNLVEMPVFGHSDNHAGIQASDLICSALLFPMAVYAYCVGHIINTMHVHPRYKVIQEHFGERIKAMQYRYQDENMRWRGGITVSDGISHRSGSLLFAP